MLDLLKTRALGALLMLTVLVGCADPTKLLMPTDPGIIGRYELAQVTVVSAPAPDRTVTEADFARVQARLEHAVRSRLSGAIPGQRKIAVEVAVESIVFTNTFAVLMIGVGDYIEVKVTVRDATPGAAPTGAPLAEFRIAKGVSYAAGGVLGVIVRESSAPGEDTLAQLVAAEVWTQLNPPPPKT